MLLERRGLKPIWEGLLNLASLTEGKKNNSTTRFMEQYRGCWSETGHEDSIYSNAEIINHLGNKKVDVWTQQPQRAGGFDPAFAHGGDRCVLVLGDCGKAICNLRDLPCVETKEIIYLDDDLDSSKDKKDQVVEKLKQACIKHNLDPARLAMDATGGGDVFATLMARDPFFSNKFARIQFGGEGSDMVSGGRKGKDKFVNMVSELWYSGKPLLRMGQIKGLKPDIMNEMTKRLYEESSGSKNKIRVESKEKMKLRLNGKSPDCADAFFLMLHICRMRLGLSSAEVVGKTKKPPPPSSNDPMAGMFAWGLKKKPKLNEPEYVQSGGGWADDSF